MGLAATHGRAAEALAVAYLELSGFRVLDRNVRLGGVEVDVLAVERGDHVVVEVKYRARSDYGGPAAAVDPSKRARLLRAASALVARGHERVRIDVVAIERIADGLELRHYRGAVES
jgi:putative endonuclease